MKMKGYKTTFHLVNQGNRKFVFKKYEKRHFKEGGNSQM